MIYYYEILAGFLFLHVYLWQYNIRISHDLSNKRRVIDSLIMIRGEEEGGTPEQKIGRRLMEKV